MRGKYSQFIRNNKYTAYLTSPAPPHSLLSLSHLFLPHSAESGCQSQTITRIVRRAQTSCSMVSWCLPCSSSAGARQHSSLSLSLTRRGSIGGQEARRTGGGWRGRRAWQSAVERLGWTAHMRGGGETTSGHSQSRPACTETERLEPAREPVPRLVESGHTQLHKH